jgi:hypothetical protein
MSATTLKVAKDMTDDEAQAGYLKYKKAWDDADIPWNKKGSPHHLKLKYRWYAKHLPINKMISATMRYYGPQLAANIAKGSALLRHLTRK